MSAATERDVLTEARRRYHNDPLFHARVKLAANVVMTTRQPPVRRAHVLDAAAVALVLAETPHCG